MAPTGRRDRESRIIDQKSGSWASSSQDLLYLAVRLFRISKEESASMPDHNMSRFVYAGIPFLLAAVHSFIVEYEGILPTRPLPIELSREPLAEIMEKNYGLSGDALQDLKDLVEIRNEIIHPVPLPTGTQDNWPTYLKRVKTKGILNSQSNPEFDYSLLGQIASHKLYVWAVDVTEVLYSRIVESDATKAPMFRLVLREFKKFK